MKLFAFVRDVAEAGAKQMLWVVIRWEVVLGSPGVLRVRVCADVAGAGAKWLLWAVIKWEGGVLGWGHSCLGGTWRGGVLNGCGGQLLNGREGFWGGGLTWGHSRSRVTWRGWALNGCCGQLLNGRVGFWGGRLSWGHSRSCVT